MIEEMDEEEEILPDENAQSENISSEQTLEEISNLETPTEDITQDLQAILDENMAVIREIFVEKNIFRKNIITIRTLQQIEREKRPATPE